MIIRLKDFILDDIPDKEECETKKRKKTEYHITLEYENDSDFILKKTSPRSEKLLVVLVSQGQIYIKDVKANTIEKVDKIEQIKNFKKGVSFDEIPSFSKLQWTPFDWGEYTHFKMLLTDTDSVKELMNRKLNPFKDFKLLWSYRADKEAFTSNFEMMKAVQLIKEDFKFSDYPYLLDTMRKCGVTHNNVKENLEIINDLGFNSFAYIFNQNRAIRVFETYNCNFKAFLTWLTYTIKHRNHIDICGDYYYSSGFNLGDYVDYLNCQYQMYGKVKEKYPENWYTDKHIMNHKYTAWKRLNENKTFKLHQEKLLQDVAYGNKKYQVVIPLDSADILDEAQQQQHCVASYVDRIVKGETNIVFIRDKEDLEKSLLTVEIRNGAIVQVRGFQNRMYTKEEYDFMVDWSKNKKLELKVAEVNV